MWAPIKQRDGASTEVSRGSDHPEGWEIILQTDPKQLEFVWAHAWQENTSMAPSLVVPVGNKNSHHGFPRERQKKLGEKEHILISPGLQGSIKSLPLEAAREQGAAPHPTEHLLHMN